MPSQLKNALIKTIIYADLFDYPLKKEEIWKWLIKFKIQNSKFKITSENSKLIKEKDGYYFYHGRDSIVSLRKQKKKWSEEKIIIAKKITSLIRLIPSIKLIGVTGALAINNVKEDDDIDFIIVTSHGLLWTTRFITTILVEIFGKRRHPKEREVRDKICLNMFLDEEHLSVPVSDRDLFSAHEVVQMKPLWDKDDTYQKFLQANLWVRDYLPNAMRIKYPILSIKYKKESFILNYVENLLKRLQLWHMRKRRTKEVISEGIIRFHPKDAREWILRAYQKKIRKIIYFSS